MTTTDGVLWAFVAVLFVLGLALVASRWPVWAKGLLVTAVTALYFWSDAALEQVWGWPSRHALPERFVLLAAVFDEPAKGREGALHVWVNEIRDGKPLCPPAYSPVPVFPVRRDDSGVWTRDASLAYRLGRGIQAGRVWTNCYHAYPAHAAFGGYKESGIGRETHKMMLDHYQQTKNLLVSYSENKLGFF